MPDPRTNDSPRSALRRNQASLIPDLRAGGKLLAPLLKHYRRDPDALVLALVRGGVPAAVAAGDDLQLPTDTVLVRKLLAPHGPNLPVCAATVAGHLVLNQRLPELEARAEPALRSFIADAKETLIQRTQLCRGARAPVEISGRTVLLIDNGVRTGATVRASVDAIRQLQPKRIVVAIPVGSSECRAMLENVSDEVICPAWHDAFGHVGMWYAKYDVPPVEEIRGLMEGDRQPAEVPGSPEKSL